MNDYESVVANLEVLDRAFKVQGFQLLK